MKTVNRSIDVKYLKTFTQVARYKSFSAAAESLFMTQPTVSQHIKRIESAIGASILDRRDGTLLTKHGLLLLEYADQALSMYEKLFEDLDRVELRNHFNIAISESFCSDMVDRIINDLSSLNNIDLDITGFTIGTHLDVNDYDLVFSLGRLPYTNGCSYQLNTVNYAIAYPPMLDPCEYNPQRIVYCHTLNRSYVQNALKEHRIDVSAVTSWVSTSSLRFFKDELESSGAVFVFPEWSLRNLDCCKLTIDQKANMYVWFSDEVSHELEALGLRHTIEELTI
jgi:DNA-binding transcriptional LysR family regulator